MNVRVNGEKRELAPGTSVAELVRSLGLAPEQVAVELNRELVRRDRHAGTVLGDGDAVEIVTLVGGG